MKTKQQAIQEAYGEYWETVKDYVDENGFCNYFPSIEIEKYFFKTGLDTVCYRPKSLQGIENNNGWIKIETEDDLPKETIDSITCFYDGKNYVQGQILKRNAKQIWDAYKSGQITHYQPIEKRKPPIH